MDADSSDDFCWICLDDASKPGSQQLINPCRCPRKVHPCCLARWQLQQAGRAEETQCRFCNSTLADWKHSLTPEPLKPEVERVQPIMVVYFEGQIHRIPVKQGNDGLHEFTSRIRELFRLPEDVDISLTFGCKEPMSGQHLKLEGIGAFDAAVHCASVAAAERQHKLRSTGGGSAGAAASGGGGGGTSSSVMPSSQVSAGGASSSGGSTQSSPSAPSSAPSSHHSRQRGSTHHRSTTHLRHSTGSSWPPPSPIPSHTISSADTEASTPMQSDSPRGSPPDAPSPFMAGPPAWAYTAAPQATPLLMDEQLLLQQHLQQLAQPYYTPHHAYTSTFTLPEAQAPRPASALPPLPPPPHPFPSYSSLDVLAPGTPNASLQDAHARHASLMTLLSAPSLSDRVPSSHAAAGPGAAAFPGGGTYEGSAGGGTPLDMHQPLPCSQTRRHSAMAVETFNDPSASPPHSVDGMNSVDGHGHGPEPVPSASGRRARRSSSQFGEAPQPPHVSAMAHGDDLYADGDAGCADYGEVASAEAMAWAASFTGRLRYSLKALSRKLVRSLNSLAHRPPHTLTTVSGRDLHGLSAEELHYRLHQQANLLGYSSVEAMHDMLAAEAAAGQGPEAQGTM